MATKYCRALTAQVTTGNGTGVALYTKFLYEFWGYCVNGTASLSTPGGLASTTPTGGGIPVNFLEGTSVTVSGNDGYTNYGSNVFTATGSTPFNSSMVGQYLTLWSPGSGSSQDSIYLITGFISSSQIIVNVINGGTPDTVSGNLHPVFTIRSGLNYRVFNALTAQTSGVTNGNYFVIQMNASGINTGQANPQIMIKMHSNNDLGIVVSPGGTWNGSAFTDNNNETRSSGAMFSNAVTFVSCVTMIADVDFFMMHVRDSGMGAGSVIHIEIPQRIYSQAQDPNPVVALLVSQGGLGVSGTNSFGGGYWMLGDDGTMRQTNTLVRSMSGDGNPWPFGPNSPASPQLGYNILKQQLLGSPAILGQFTLNHFSLSRCKLRKIMFTGAFLQPNRRLGLTGIWYHLASGICWPWDNTIIPVPLLQQGN